VASTEAISEALADWAAREIDDPHELDREGLELVPMLEDLVYAIQRRAERVGETNLAERIFARFENVAAVARHTAAYADEMLGFPIVTQRR
jgi:hypothetical protein